MAVTAEANRKTQVLVEFDDLAMQIVNLEQVLVNGFSVLPDARMLGIQTSDLERGEVTSMNVVLNVFDELRRKPGSRK